ncbi:MAG: Dabb family protein [Oscillospiraceae bacterium]|nr:Dabb family protein [Oscillospiraceae bacterium]
MIKHIILWTLKEQFTPNEKQQIKQGIKDGLEGLAGQIPGLLSIHVYTEGLDTSTADLMLDSSFESTEALKAYAKHPAHLNVAEQMVRPYTALRSCLDFELQEGTSL